jgi:exopolysaccharide production protein ExoQ
MGSSLAILVYSLGIAGLFYLDRDKSVRTSSAVWLPVLWMWIVGSRPVSVWLGLNPSTASASQLLDGSPFDRLVFAILLAAGLIVLLRRNNQTITVLRENWPITIFFTYCLLSALWSDFPDVALKRWTKAIGDLVMVLIVVTDPEPIAAIKRFFSRTGFILLPASVLLIKYFEALGRGYDPWFGTVFNNGVTTNKNALGVITFVLSLGALWRVLALLRKGELRDRRRHLLAQGTLLAFGVMLLTMANSATSVASFALGAGLMLATGMPFVRRRPAAVHALVLVLILTAGAVVLLGGDEGVVHALGRNTTLTGRTDIWKLVIPMTPNPMIGAGFESFWLGPRLEELWRKIPNLYLNEAHNGYIEVYLNLGWVGLALIMLMFINGYRRSIATFRRDPALGGLLLASVLATALYNLTEAGFRMLYPMWIFFLLTVVASNSTAPGGVVSQPLDVLGGRASCSAASNSRHSQQLATMEDCSLGAGRQYAAYRDAQGPALPRRS